MTKKEVPRNARPSPMTHEVRPPRLRERGQRSEGDTPAEAAAPDGGGDKAAPRET